MFILGFVVGFLACSLLCIEMLQRKGLMNKDGVIADLSEKRPTKDAPVLGESSASDSESKPAPKRVI
jgi:hypothetical protein